MPRGHAYTDASVCVTAFSQPCLHFLTATLPQRGSSPKTKDLVKLINQSLGHQEKDRYRAPRRIPDFPLADTSHLSCVESWSHPKGSNVCLSICPAVAAGTPCWQPMPTLWWRCYRSRTGTAHPLIKSPPNLWQVEIGLHAEILLHMYLYQTQGTPPFLSKSTCQLLQTRWDLGFNHTSWHGVPETIFCFN